MDSTTFGPGKRLRVKPDTSTAVGHVRQPLAAAFAAKEQKPMNDVERIVRIFHESWDLRDPERGVSVIAEDCRFEDVARGELQTGPDGYRQDYHRWRAAFPDGEVKVTNVITGGDWAVVEFVNRGTQTGALQSSLGDFPPSGRSMEVRYCSVMRVQDGKVVEGRDYYDSASIVRQLGLVS